MLQHGIQHVLYPTSWFSSLPFYTSLQVQQSYSYANNIVMLASSANSPISGQGGSGIFVGRSGAVAMILPAESTQYVWFQLINLYIIESWCIKFHLFVVHQAANPIKNTERHWNLFSSDQRQCCEAIQFKANGWAFHHTNSSTLHWGIANKWVGRSKDVQG